MIMHAGRKNVDVSKLFMDVSNSKAKVRRVQCKFCQTSVAKNGTRMKTPVEKCFLCPKLINSFLGACFLSKHFRKGRFSEKGKRKSNPS